MEEGTTLASIIFCIEEQKGTTVRAKLLVWNLNQTGRDIENPRHLQLK